MSRLRFLLIIFASILLISLSTTVQVGEPLRDSGDDLQHHPTHS